MILQRWFALVLGGIMLVSPWSSRAADTNVCDCGGSGGAVSWLGDYFTHWFDRVDKTMSEQPHWASPLVTTVPYLQEILRYDQTWESVKGGHSLDAFGSGKGLEFIPAERIQFIVGVPVYQEQDTTPHKNGWADESFLMKYRLWAGNETNGNYVVSAFMGLTVPNGSGNYTTHHFVYAPSLAAGKGWGDFDIQSTVGVTVPDNGAARDGLGTPILVNTVFQYHLAKVFWPEMELNYSYWPNGTREGNNQLFVTPGIMFGKFPLWDRIKLSVGAGCQVAVTKNPAYYRNVILTARTAF